MRLLLSRYSQEGDTDAAAGDCTHSASAEAEAAVVVSPEREWLIGIVCSCTAIVSTECCTSDTSTTGRLRYYYAMCSVLETIALSLLRCITLSYADYASALGTVLPDFTVHYF
jgi:hypothetical protein